MSTLKTPSLDSKVILASTPATPADWLLRGAALAKGSPHFFPALFDAVVALIGERRMDQARPLAEVVALLAKDAKDERFPGKPAALAYYLNRRMGKATPPPRGPMLLRGSDEMQEHYGVLWTNGFPRSVTRWAGVEDRIPPALWQHWVPLMRCLKEGNLAEAKPLVSLAAKALPSKKPKGKKPEYEDAGVALAACHLFRAAAETGDAVTAKRIEAIYGPWITPPFEVAGLIALKRDADAKRAAVAAARKAASNISSPNCANKHLEIDRGTGPMVKLLLAQGKKEVAAEVLKLLSDAAGAVKVWVPTIRAAVHANLAALIAQTGDESTARSLLEKALAVAKKLKHPDERSSAWSQIANALAKLGDRDGAIEAAGRVPERATKQAVLATLHVEFGEPAKAIPIVDKASKVEDRLFLCNACARQLLSTNVHFTLSTEE